MLYYNVTSPLLLRLKFLRKMCNEHTGNAQMYSHDIRTLKCLEFYLLLLGSFWHFPLCKPTICISIHVRNGIKYLLQWYL